MYTDVMEFIQNLSIQICKHFKIITPNIHLQLSPNYEFYGSMIPHRKREKIIIELIIPHNIELTKKTKTMLAVTIIHEHCHYVESYKLSAEKRKISMDQYIKNASARKTDEFRTWRCTKKVAQDLGYWSKSFFNAIKEFQYTSEISYK